MLVVESPSFIRRFVRSFAVAQREIAPHQCVMRLPGAGRQSDGFLRTHDRLSPPTQRCLHLRKLSPSSGTAGIVCDYFFNLIQRLFKPTLQSKCNGDREEVAFGFALRKRRSRVLFSEDGLTQEIQNLRAD